MTLVGIRPVTDRELEQTGSKKEGPNMVGDPRLSPKEREKKLQRDEAEGRKASERLMKSLGSLAGLLGLTPRKKTRRKKKSLASQLGLTPRKKSRKKFRF